MDSVFPPEVESVILSKLRKSDLLNCRAVCRSWNQECRMHLNNSEHTMELNEETVEEFAALTDDGENRWTDLPIPVHLCLNIKKSIAIEYDYREASTRYVKKMEDHIMPSVDKLLQRFGQECVVSLRIKSNLYTEDSLRILFKFFNQISRGLKAINVDMLEINIRGDDRVRLINRVQTEVPLDFPKLRSIKAMRGIGAEYYAEIATPFLQILIGASPQLTEWDRDLYYYREFGALPFHKLKILKLGGIHNHLDFVQEIQACPAPLSLSELAIWEMHDEPELQKDLIQLTSSTLKSIHLPLPMHLKNPANFMQLPSLPLLEKLCITYTGETLVRISVDPLGPFNMRPQDLPQLNYVETVFGIAFRNPESGQPYSVPTVVFPKVTTLKVKVRYLMMTDSGNVVSLQFLMENWDNLFATFPGARRVILVNDGKRGIFLFKYVLKALMLVNGSGKLAELEISNCRENYLAEIYLQNKSPPRCVLENFEMNSELLEIMGSLFLTLCVGSGLDLHVEEVNDEMCTANGKKLLVVQEKRSILFINQMTNLRKIRLIHIVDNLTLGWCCDYPPGIEDYQRKPFKGFETFKYLFPALQELELSRGVFGQFDNEFTLASYLDWDHYVCCNHGPKKRFESSYFEDLENTLPHIVITVV